MFVTVESNTGASCSNAENKPPSGHGEIVSVITEGLPPGWRKYIRSWKKNDVPITYAQIVTEAGKSLA
jgi:hypothetical protein